MSKSSPELLIYNVCIAQSELIKSVEGFSNIQNGNYSAVGTNNNIQINSGEKDMKLINNFMLNLSERIEKLEKNMKLSNFLEVNAGKIIRLILVTSYSSR